MSGIKKVTGTIVTTKIDKSIFVVGSAWQIKLETNIYVNAILTNVTDDKVTFLYVKNYGDKESIEVEYVTYNYINIYHHDLMRLGYDIYKITENV